MIVNPRNRVRSLSTAQLRGIYSGRIVNWKELGGDDAGITVYTRDSASGTREVFLELALDREPITDRAQFAVSNGAVKAAVSQDPDAIGYISAGFIDGSVRGVSLDGIAPEIGNIRQGIYPVSRILYTNTKGEPEGLARKMIDYLLSPEGRMIIEEKGFIPIR